MIFHKTMQATDKSRLQNKGIVLSAPGLDGRDHYFCHFQWNDKSYPDKHYGDVLPPGCTNQARFKTIPLFSF